MISMQFVYIIRFCKEVKTNNEQGKCWPGMELLNLWLVGSTLGLLVMNLYRKKNRFNTWPEKELINFCTNFYMLLLPRLSCHLFLLATSKISFCLILMSFFFDLRTRHSINGLQRNVDFHHDPLPEFFAENSHGSNCLYRHGCLQVDSLIHFFSTHLLMGRVVVLRTGSGLVWFPMHIWRIFTLSIMEPRASREVGIVQAWEKGNAMWTALQYIYINGRHAVKGVVQLYADIALGFMCGCSRWMVPAPIVPPCLI